MIGLVTELVSEINAVSNVTGFPILADTIGEIPPIPHMGMYMRSHGHIHIHIYKEYRYNKGLARDQRCDQAVTVTNIGHVVIPTLRAAP